MPSLKETFSKFHTFREFFHEYGPSYILKFNEFYSVLKFDEFSQTLNFLLDENILEPAGDDLVKVFVYRLHTMQPETLVHRVYRLTDKGRQLVSVLPSQMSL